MSLFAAADPLTVQELLALLQAAGLIAGGAFTLGYLVGRSGGRDKS